jgi:hypothetical protein
MNPFDGYVSVVTILGEFACHLMVNGLKIALHAFLLFKTDPDLRLLLKIGQAGLVAFDGCVDILHEESQKCSVNPMVDLLLLESRGGDLLVHSYILSAPMLNHHSYYTPPTNLSVLPDTKKLCVSCLIFGQYVGWKRPRREGGLWWVGNYNLPSCVFANRRGRQLTATKSVLPSASAP